MLYGGDFSVPFNNTEGCFLNLPKTIPGLEKIAQIGLFGVLHMYFSIKLYGQSNHLMPKTMGPLSWQAPGFTIYFH